MELVRFSDFSIDVVKSVICHYKYHYGPRTETNERRVCTCETTQPKIN